MNQFIFMQLAKIENAIKEQEEKTNEGKKKKAEKNDEISNSRLFRLSKKKSTPFQQKYRLKLV